MAIRWIAPEDTNDPTGPHTVKAIDAASWLLYKLTAEKYPGRQRTTECYSNRNTTTMPATPVVVGGQIYNILSPGSRKLQLRQKPAMKIHSVSINGTVLDPNSYQLRNNAFLVKTDLTYWNFSPTSEICVDYEYGLNPPAAGKQAALILANEFINYHMHPSQCKLPERVTSVSRQQVSFSVLDPQTFLNEGKVGIYAVDLFITTANPGRAKKQPKIFSPNRPNGERIN